MKGDFSRFTFRPTKRYTSVRMQQGRAALDADWNEQAAIREYVERLRFEDIVGACGAPGGAGFAVHTDEDGRLRLGAGRLYLNGLACELDEPTLLEPLLTNPLTPAPPQTYLVYLDAWERHLTAVDDPDLLEPALAGADTTTRLQVAWTIGLVEDVGDDACSNAEAFLPKRGPATMDAAAPNGYLGVDNHLYRVEIHDQGQVGSATFKWSRDNGSVAFGIDEFLGAVGVRVAPSRLAESHPLAIGDWVEVSGDNREIKGVVGTLTRIRDVSAGERTVEFTDDVSGHRNEGHPRVRRWDQRSGATMPVASEWTELEAGIVVRFSGSDFRSGDYWTIPARPGTEAVDWPTDDPPEGVEHRLCPLAFLTWEQTNEAWKLAIRDCRRAFSPLIEVHAELAWLKSEVTELRRKLAAAETAPLHPASRDAV